MTLLRVLLRAVRAENVRGVFHRAVRLSTFVTLHSTVSYLFEVEFPH